MSAFTLLWQKILRSSLWVKESKETRLVWIALLAMKDQNGEVHSSVIGLADSAKVTQEECRRALDTLTSTDLDDTSGVEEGRRLKQIPGGWQIVNNDLYRFSTETKREFWRQSQKDYRLQKKLKETQPIKTEEPSPADTSKKYDDARVVLKFLSQKTGKDFREVESNLKVINARMSEPDVTVDGIKQMIARQCKLWGNDEKMREFLRPSTLFGKEKFDGYYAAREQPVNRNNSHETPSQLSDAELLRQSQM
jgi:uncharacterized phage protein (TIGR02220 family)